MITAMSLNDVLTLTLLIGIAVMIGLALRRETTSDGYGHRAAPRSHPEENETRAQLLQRLA
jgi:hypothetical protein